MNALILFIFSLTFYWSYSSGSQSKGELLISRSLSNSINIVGDSISEFIDASYSYSIRIYSQSILLSFGFSSFEIYFNMCDKSFVET